MEGKERRIGREEGRERGKEGRKSPAEKSTCPFKTVFTQCAFTS